MSEFIDPRMGDAPSELTLDAYVAGDAEPAQIAEVEAWMAADPANAAVVEARQSGFAAFAEARPQVMLARIRQGMEAEAAEARAAQATAPAARGWSLSQWMMLALGGLAAAAAVVWFAVRPPQPAGGEADGIILKGDLTLRVFRERGGEVHELLSGDAVQPRDTLRFKPEKLPAEPGYLLVAGVEADGDVFPYYPGDGKAVDPQGLLDADGVLPGSSVLDDSKGRERAWLVWCPAPFTTTDLQAQGDALRAPTGCKQGGFALEKP